jgi:hypothetical protein
MLAAAAGVAVFYGARSILRELLGVSKRTPKRPVIIRGNQVVKTDDEECPPGTVIKFRQKLNLLRAGSSTDYPYFPRNSVRSIAYHDDTNSCDTPVLNDTWSVTLTESTGNFIELTPITGSEGIHLRFVGAHMWTATIADYEFHSPNVVTKISITSPTSEEVYEPDGCFTLELYRNE